MWAQTTPSGTEPFSIGALIIQVGLSGIFLWQWRTERDLRIKRDDQVIGILERQGPVLALAVNTLEAVQSSQAAITLKWERFAIDLQHAADDLRDEVRKRG